LGCGERRAAASRIVSAVFICTAICSRFVLTSCNDVNVELLCSCRVGRTLSPRRRRSAVLMLPADCVSPTFVSASTSVSRSIARQTKHSSLTLSSPAPSGTHVESVAVVKPVSQQRYSLSVIAIPRLSISDDADSSDSVTGQSVSSVFHLHNTSATRELSVYLDGLRLRHECHPTYLGLTLDRTLSYREHLTKTAGKLKN